MNTVNQTLDYLIPPENYFWKWEDEEDVAVWADGSTLAFKVEIEEIIRHLAPYGLPSTGAVLIVLAATRKSWDGNKVRDLFEKSLETIPVFSHYTSILDSVFFNLEQIHHQIPDAIRNTDLGSSVCELIFRNAPDYMHFQASKAVIEGINQGISCNELVEIKGSETVQKAVIKDLETLEKCLADFNASGLFNSVKTGVSSLPQKLELSVKGEDKISLRSLLADENLRGLGLLIQKLLAVVNMPRTVTDIDHLPLGGVSDISNRGELDKLLISELANDDLTLAVRIANKEALYIRREAPPGKPPVKKTVFLDQGIRYWGKARIFALAVAVSLSLKDTGDNTSFTFTSHINGRFKEIDLNTHEDILAMMEILESTLSPVDALKHFFFHNDMADEECLFIFHEKQMKDPKLTSFLKKLNLPLYSLFLIDEEGRFKLIRVSESEKKVISEATLDLECIFEQKEVVKELETPEPNTTGLPLFYSYSLCPLKVPLWDKIKAFSHYNYYLVTTSNQLVLREKGAKTGVYFNLNIPENADQVHCHDNIYYFRQQMYQRITITAVDPKSPNYSSEFSIPHSEGNMVFIGPYLVMDKLRIKYSLTDGAKSSVSEAEKKEFRKKTAEINSGIEPVMRSGTKIHRFQSIIFKKNEKAIYLRTRQGKYVKLERSSKFNFINSCEFNNTSHSKSVTFKPLLEQPFKGFILQRAEFNNGLKVYLDSRGFLHLVNPRKSIEISILLNNRGSAVWTSNGLFSGNDDFHFDGTKNQDAVTALICDFVENIFI